MTTWTTGSKSFEITPKRGAITTNFHGQSPRSNSFRRGPANGGVGASGTPKWPPYTSLNNRHFAPFSFDQPRANPTSPHCTCTYGAACTWPTTCDTATWTPPAPLWASWAFRTCSTERCGRFQCVCAARATGNVRPVGQCPARRTYVGVAMYPCRHGVSMLYKCDGPHRWTPTTSPRDHNKTYSQTTPFYWPLSRLSSHSRSLCASSTHARADYTTHIPL